MLEEMGAPTKAGSVDQSQQRVGHAKMRSWSEDDATRMGQRG